MVEEADGAEACPKPSGTPWRFVGPLGWFVSAAYAAYMYPWFLANVMATMSDNPAWAHTTASQWGWWVFGLPTSLLALIAPEVVVFVVPALNALLLAYAIGAVRRSRERVATLK